MRPNKDLYIHSWSNCLAHIRQRTSKEEFAKWFAEISLYDYDGQTLKLGVPDKESAEYIDSHYISFLKPVIMQEFGTTTRLTYVVKPKEEDAPQTSNPFSVPVRQIRIVDPQLNFDYSFENFVIGECNRLASVTGRAVAQDPGRSVFNPIFIYGGSGLGKTHLVQAIGTEIKKNFPEKNVLYVSANTFLDQFMNVCRKKEVAEFVSFYQSLDVLILDDIQAFSGKLQTQDVFFNIFQNLHLSNRQLIFTCDKGPDNLIDIDQRLITRFKWAVCAELTYPDYDTRLRIIEDKAKRLNLNIDKEMAAYLSTNLNVSIREIEGAVSVLIAYTKMMDRGQSLELARSIVATYAREKAKREVTVESIQEMVCDVFGVTKKDFFSVKRTKEVALARQAAMTLIKDKTSLSLKAIGEMTGGKSHATVLHAIKNVANMEETDNDFRACMNDIRSKLR